MKDSLAPLLAGLGSFLALVITAGHVLILAALTGVVSSPQAALGPGHVRCNFLEQSAVHYHVAVRLHFEEQTRAVPARTGIKPACLYWVHTHDRSGIVHIEAPAEHGKDVFHLADLFAISRAPLDSTQVGNHLLTPDEKLTVYVEGERWNGEPGEVPFVEHQTIDVVVSRSADFVYESFEWPEDF